MPFTLSHPAAVLPLKSIAPKRFLFSALVIGSLIPDVSYVFRNSRLAVFAHSFEGAIGFCVPVGLIFFAVFCAVRQPIASMLPAPHRQALLPLCTPISSPLSRVVFSILIGALTHVVWDSFTHEHGWFVRNIPALRERVHLVGNYEIVLCRLIQHTSTLAGLLALAASYFSWLSRRVGAREAFSFKEPRQYLAWLALLLLPAVLAIPFTFDLEHGMATLQLRRHLLSRAAVNYLAALFASLAVVGFCGLLLKRLSPRFR